MKFHGFALAAAVFSLIAAGCLASGNTIRTWTPFADLDFAAQPFMDMVQQWEDDTGNIVEDYSAVQDDDWFTDLNDALTGKQTDIVVIPAGTEMDFTQFVTVDELLSADPECGARKLDSYADSDGTIRMTPVRINWEGLYVNTDVLEANGVELPETLEQLIDACVKLSAAGIVPVSNAPADWAEVLVECASVSSAPDETLGSEVSLAGASGILAALKAVGAFGTDGMTVDDDTAMERFLNGEAAMRFDDSGLAESVPEERIDQVKVIAIQGQQDGTSLTVPGTPLYGLAVSKAALEDESRKADVLSLVRVMLKDESLVSPVTGKLGSSIAALSGRITRCAGTLFDTLGDDTEARIEEIVQILKTM